MQGTRLPDELLSGSQLLITTLNQQIAQSKDYIVKSLAIIIMH
jgi:hypothetical protein